MLLGGFRYDNRKSNWKKSQKQKRRIDSKGTEFHCRQTGQSLERN